MERICEWSKCTACGACVNTCPKDAVFMHDSGVLGFSHPYIDKKKCIDCRLCERICPVNHPVALRQPVHAFAAIARNKYNLMKSASGGGAFALGATIIENGGVVYGAVMTNYKDIKHLRLTTIEELGFMRGSKYVQSDINYTYRLVKEDLLADRLVLFTATPCQCAGLRAFLRKDYPKLHIADLVCHGVPSQKLLRDSVEHTLHIYGEVQEDDICVSFREKDAVDIRTSDFNPRYGIFLNKNSVPIARGKDTLFPRNEYITAFMAGLIFRDSCYSCPYSCSRRVSDITLADYWGLRQCSIPQKYGVSLLMPSTERGLKLIMEAKKHLIIEERNVNEAVCGNGQLNRPSVPDRNRERFIALYGEKGTAAYKDCLRYYRCTIKRRRIRLYILKMLEAYPLIYKAVWNVWEIFKSVRHKFTA